MGGKRWVSQEQLANMDGKKFLDGLDALNDPYPHGACFCGGQLDQHGICEDKCARDGYEHD